MLGQFNKHMSKIPVEQQREVLREQVLTQVMGIDGHGYAQSMAITFVCLTLKWDSRLSNVTT